MWAVLSRTYDANISADASWDRAVKYSYLQISQYMLWFHEWYVSFKFTPHILPLSPIFSPFPPSYDLTLNRFILVALGHRRK
jgi:hypothetical protein